MEPSQARGAPEATLSRALMGDRLLQAGVIVWIATLLPSCVPIFSTETTISWVDGYSVTPVAGRIRPSDNVRGVGVLESGRREY